MYLSRLARVGLDPCARLSSLKTAVSVAFAANLLSSPKLWLSSRDYPLAPVSGSLPRISFPLDYLCLAALFALLILIAFTRRPRAYLVLFVLVVTLYSLWDQARWTPPVYQYTFMLATLSFYSWGHSDQSKRDAILNACRTIIAGTYLWAGVQKINITFMSEVFPWMLKPFVGTLLADFRGSVWPLGLFAALLEAAIGAGLLFSVTRQAAVVAAVAVHGFILLCIGPLGHWWDTNVWPWNIAAACLAVILFWRTEATGVREILFPGRFCFRWIVLALFVFMPALNFIGLWDDYLSAAFYSGNTRRGLIQMTGETKAALPEKIRRYVRPNRAGIEVLDLTRWAFATRNVEPYPETRVFKDTARQLCRYSEDPSGLTLVIHEKPNWRTGRRHIAYYTCTDLDAPNAVTGRVRLP